VHTHPYRKHTGRIGPDHAERGLEPSPANTQLLLLEAEAASHAAVRLAGAIAASCLLGVVTYFWVLT
jgi:hypothetical protein